MAGHFYWIVTRVLVLACILMAWRGVVFGLRHGRRFWSWFWCCCLVVDVVWAVTLVVLG